MIKQRFMLVALAALVGACTVTAEPPPANYIILSGSSFFPSTDSSDRAVAAAQAALTNAQAAGCRGVSVGGGTGIGFGLCSNPTGDCIEGGAQYHAVHVLVACPLGTRLNPDGTAAGP